MFGLLVRLPSTERFFAIDRDLIDDWIILQIVSPGIAVGGNRSLVTPVTGSSTPPTRLIPIPFIPRKWSCRKYCCPCFRFGDRQRRRSPRLKAITLPNPAGPPITVPEPPTRRMPGPKEIEPGCAGGIGPDEVALNEIADRGRSADL